MLKGEIYKGKVSIPGDATARAAVEAFGPFPSPARLPSLHNCIVFSLSVSLQLSFEHGPTCIQPALQSTRIESTNTANLVWGS